MVTDDIDSRLVLALQEDGRASVNALASRLGLPRSSVSSHLHRLLSDGTVRVIAAVDPAFMGQHVLAHVSVRTTGPVADLARRICLINDAVLVSAVAGSHDLVTEVRVGSLPELHTLLAGIRRMTRVHSISTLTYTQVHKGFFVSHYGGEVTIDRVDALLIERLQENGRTAYRDLARECGIAPSTAAARVRRLIDGRVIAISTVERRGLARRQMSMGVGLNLGTDGPAVLTTLAAMRSVDFVAHTIGRFDAVATIVRPTTHELYTSVEQIRGLRGVRAVETWLHLEVLKEDYARPIRPAPARGVLARLGRPGVARTVPGCDAADPPTFEGEPA